MNSVNQNYKACCLTVFSPDGNKDEVSLAWVPHPVFKGVYLKHLVTGGDTGGHLSLHLVKVGPRCALAEHQHENQIELHEVLQGKGTCRMQGRSIGYVPGRLAVIPLGSLHEVAAGEEGLLIKAVFTPALL